MSDCIKIGDATLYHGDCLEILPTLPKVDAVVTDPPYGVNGGSGTLGIASAKTKYKAEWCDTEQYLIDTIIPAFEMALELADCAVVTPGSPCAFLYPRPADLGALYQPATTGMAKWGRETVQPVLFYGKDPRAGLTIQAKHYQNTARASDDRHPCAKPIGVAEWMVHRASDPGHVILDPFMGSGTTGVACMNLGRKFIGIEIERKYFDIACERIENAQRQARMFA